MNAREYLWQLKNIDKRIEDKMDEAQRWRDIAENTTSKLSKDKVQTSPKPDKMADAITNAVMYEQESEEIAKKLTEFKHKVTLQIDEIDDFRRIWNKTLKDNDWDKYIWEENPFVWVIRFERCEKPESEE